MSLTVAKKKFTEAQPEKALLTDTHGGGKAFLEWVGERGSAVDPRMDSIEECRMPARTLTSLIDRLNYAGMWGG